MGWPDVMEAAIEVAPEIPRCMGAEPNMELKIVDRAIEFNCQKVQFFHPYCNQKLIDFAHENGILCNYFFSDDPAWTMELLKLGIDTVLTNDYFRNAQARDRFLAEKRK